MKKLLTFFASLALSYSFAQDNTLPVTGKVGMGTLTPTQRLQLDVHYKGFGIHMGPSISIYSMKKQEIAPSGYTYSPHNESEFIWGAEIGVKYTFGLNKEES